MQISRKVISRSADGRTIYGFRFQNSSGSAVELTNWGARWLSAVVPDRQGQLADVLLAPADLLSDPYYMGATVGRVANRIANAHIVVDGKGYSLERNDNANSNHGGFEGFDRKWWDWHITDCGIIFSRLSPDGENGFPGNVSVEVEYRWSNDNEMTILYRATTDALTCLNLTNHAYFNLSGTTAATDTAEGNSTGGDITGHMLHIPSHTILETDATFIPTGMLLDVGGTPFDFTAFKRIGKDLNADNEQLRWNRGYNHCYVLKTKSSDIVIPAAYLTDPASGRTLKVTTSQNSVLLYSSGYYSRPAAALCLETQNWPDAPSHDNFPSCLLRPNEMYSHQTQYKFGVTGNM